MKPKDLARVEKIVYTPDDACVRYRRRVLALKSDGTVWGCSIVKKRAVVGASPEVTRNHGWKMLRVAKPIYVKSPELWVDLCEDQGWKKVRRR